jgi:hypothetical protein
MPGRLQSRAQAPNVDIDRTLFNKDVITPDFIKQLGAGVDPFGMRHEEKEQTKLGRPQFNRLTTRQHTMGCGIERQITDFNRFTSQMRRAATQYGTHARH